MLFGPARKLFYRSSMISWISKFESGKLELESVPFALRDVVDQAMDLLAPMAFGKGLEIAPGSIHELPRLWSATSPG